GAAALAHHLHDHDNGRDERDKLAKRPELASPASAGPSGDVARRGGQADAI
ncbi:MAG: hypothetical protein QOF20_3379, partial [Acidimicrobiaceae bacterium]|nr:hypothetical protein [Acidimicrobiaceae bacterium]